ncbi:MULTISPECIES: acyl carrier protein [Sphingobacterium]|jgi:acyl carrier protein|uniref:acyl carrier protein n=1 Tax=Sphingobacterium TaxID=28453 RepID=UPI00105274D0|nr:MULTISPECIES: phosphopantetheine-binding protein [Sphingobacterium]MCS3553037.1 acyl carrier protein [Sphingobacterium sp. JUb21]MCW2258884.1 acyl carrier protein [Sphingobacterium kitahiroshimense]NJI73010.1 acyl carrier protein [Sphingobacterium sp. B16(2022)]TCR10209.1 acyl carrier protein [Sphingobacterium sp. JUb20]TCR14663.1 acyl carrier protein [Sphingobacterium sp. JUb78]
MNKEMLIGKLKEIIKPYTTNLEAYENLNEDTDFINDLNINSANLVDIVLDIEQIFDVVIDNADMERMLNVRTAVEIIEIKLAQK